MTTTIKDVEEMMERVEGLSLFLAGVRSTLHLVATKGKEGIERAIKAEARVAELEEEADKWEQHSLCDCCYCMTPDPVDVGGHIQCPSCGRVAQLEARVKYLTDIINGAALDGGEE